MKVSDIATAPVEGSTNVKAIGHYRGVLVVDFRSGSRYVYRHVPARLFDRMLKAQSVGSFLDTHIKHNFPYEKVG